MTPKQSNVQRLLMRCSVSPQILRSVGCEYAVLAAIAAAAAPSLPCSQAGPTVTCNRRGTQSRAPVHQHVPQSSRWHHCTRSLAGSQPSAMRPICPVAQQRKVDRHQGRAHSLYRYQVRPSTARLPHCTGMFIHIANDNHVRKATRLHVKSVGTTSRLVSFARPHRASSQHQGLCLHGSHARKVLQTVDTRPAKRRSVRPTQCHP
jgi:hypothetical protein